jgi:CRISPR-associated protein Csx17
MTRHVLSGLRPEPLGRYLAGLGLIRLLGEQADPAATAAWSRAGLVIETTVGDIEAWLAEEYVPTPVLSPWNGGSGFGAKDKESKCRLEDLLARRSPRLGALREAIAVAEEVMRTARAAGWIEPDGKGGEKVDDKGRIVQEFRNRCPDALLPWIDATVVLADQQTFFPPLLGTGGNDGRLDFSTNFHERLLETLDLAAKGRVRSLACARDLLTGTEAERLASAAVGQFDPAAAGGQGSSPFGAAGSLVNPWEYVLLVEGALLFASGAARRHQHDAGRAARPFTVSFSPDGTASGAAGEESRGEVWVPVWSRPYTLSEIRQLFGEARASWRGRPAQQAVEFYAATRTLGVARGIDEFVRYGLQRRNGLAFVAVPLDRVQVRSRPEVRLAARVEDWMSRVRNPAASPAVGGATRKFDAAHLAYAREGGPARLRDLLAALTALEQAVGRSGRAREKAPVFRPPPARDFLDQFAKAETPELRLAVGVASCVTRPATGSARTMRQVLLPIDPADSANPRGRWRDAPIVPGFGLRPLPQVLADVLAWRSRTAAEESGAAEFRGVATFRRGIEVPARDLHAFAREQLDESALEVWLLACLALDWRGVRHPWSGSGRATLVPTLGLLHPLARGLADQEDGSAPRLAMGPDWAVRLAVGKVESVHSDAVRRLRQAGWDAVPALKASAQDGIRLAAALVPRCVGWWVLFDQYFAIPIRTERQEAGAANVAEQTDAQSPDTDRHELETDPYEQETNPHELAEELS